MKVIINEDLNLDAALTVEDFTEEEKDEALATLQQCFENTACKVLADALNQELPETIIVEMDENEVSEISDESKGVRLANFNSVSSVNNCFVFTIMEKTLMYILNHDDIESFESTIVHEMFHAADMKTLKNNTQIFQNLWITIDDPRTPLNRKLSLSALSGTLLTCDRFRAEGIAILGEHILLKSKYECGKEEALEHFKKVFQYAITKASLLVQYSINDPVFDENIDFAVYRMSPYVLLWVLDKLDVIDSNLINKAEKGLETGCYELSDEEISNIMQSALSVDLSTYIQGLLLLNDDLVPARSFLELCALLQKNDDILSEDDVKDNITAFMHLVEQKESAEAFHEAMKQIIGGSMDADEIDVCYQQFRANPPAGLADPKILDKVGLLYSVFHDDKDVDRKRIAQKALTYLFDDEDIIHDDIVGLGYVDDMIVIDSALRLLN